MKVLITGGTGFIGRSVRSELVSQGKEVITLSRANRESTDLIKYVLWSYKNPTDISEYINQSDIVVNLAGEPLSNTRWTREQKEVLYKSRVETTRLIVSAINNATRKPKKLISSSAVGIYGDRGDEKLSEASVLGNGFLAHICKDWEAEAMKAQTNVVILRIGIVIGKGGGALRRMLLPFKMSLGGPIGSGDQYMSWISHRDVVGMTMFAIENNNVTGILNATSPEPVTNKEFASTLGKVVHRPAIMPIPGFALKILFGEIADTLLAGQRVYPKKVLEYGYNFKLPNIEDALRKSISRKG